MVIGRIFSARNNRNFFGPATSTPILEAEDFFLPTVAAVTEMDNPPQILASMVIDLNNVASTKCTILHLAKIHDPQCDPTPNYIYRDRIYIGSLGLSIVIGSPSQPPVQPATCQPPSPSNQPTSHCWGIHENLSPSKR
jgi:hypothetical protein